MKTKALKTKASINEVQGPALKLRSLLSLHRRMGLVSALFLILLSISGLVLHHSTTLNLDSRFLGSSVLLGWYRIEVPSVSASFAVSGERISLIADALYFNARRLPGNYAELNGMVPADSGFVATTANQVMVLTEDGGLVEVLSRVHGVPGGILGIGTTPAGQIYLQHPAGIIEADLDVLNWTRVNLQASQLAWSTASSPGQELLDTIQSDYAGSLLSWERLILDIHSGRLFGSVGVVLVDAMALLFVLMAATGVWIWTRRRS